MTQKLRILVIDDDQTTLLVTAAVLEDAGHEVSQRTEALGSGSAIAREKPDVVLLDVNMPGLSGDELARLLKQRAATQKVGIILHSSLDAEELARVRRSTGALAAITKTSDALQFLTEFDRIVAGAARAALLDA